MFNLIAKSARTIRAGQVAGSATAVRLIIAGIIIASCTAAQAEPKSRGKPLCNITMTAPVDGPGSKVEIFRTTCYRDICTIQIGPDEDGMTTTSTGSRHDSDSCVALLSAFSCRDKK